MKEALLVAMAAGGIGAFVGGATATLLGSQQAPAPTDVVELVSALERSLGRPLADMRLELAAVRSRMERIRRDGPVDVDASSADADTEATPVPAHRARGRTSRAQPSGESGEHADLVRKTDAPNYDRLREVVEAWSEKAELRRKWMLASRQEALDWFGTPDSVQTSDDTELWYYERATGTVDEAGDPRTEQFALRFLHGLLIGP